MLIESPQATAGQNRAGPMSPLPERVIAIMAYARGGSGLWASLFDSHPNVLTFPDCVIMNFFRFWERFGAATAGAVAEAFVEHYSVAFDARRSNPDHIARLDYGSYLGLCNLGPNRDQHIHVSVARFMAGLRRRLDFDQPTSRRQFFQAIHVAYAEAQGRVVMNPVIVFGLHVRLYNDFQRLLDDFPATIFMQTIRQPIRGLASWFRHFRVTDAVYPELILSGLHMVLHHGRPEPPEQKARWFAVRLEDLHDNPRVTLERVTAWLGLPWDDCLLQSTFNGLQWWNEKNSIQLSGFSSDITAQRFEDLMPQRDAHRLACVLYPRSVRWGYAAVVPRSRWQTLRCAVGLLRLLQSDRFCIASVKIPEGATGLKSFRFYHYLPIYLRARRMLLSALFRPERDEAPVISADVGAPPRFSGRELLLIGGAVGGVDDSYFREGIRRGRVALERGDADAAIELLSAAIKAQPNVIEPYRLRAVAYEHLGRIAEANADRACCDMPPLPETVPAPADADALRREIEALLEAERAANPVSCNATGPYQGYDRIGLAAQRASVESRIEQYGLERYMSPSARVLDIGSNAGFLVVHLAHSCAQVHGVEPKSLLNRIGELTAAYLGVTDRVRFFEMPFMLFEPPHAYDLVLCLASFYTSDGGERTDAESYFSKIVSLLAPGGHLVYESTGYSNEPAELNPFGHAALNASRTACDAIGRRLIVVQDYEVADADSPGVLRRLMVARMST